MLEVSCNKDWGHWLKTGPKWGIGEKVEKAFST